MRHPAKKSSRKHSVDSHRLTELARSLAQATSRLEYRSWEKELDEVIEKCLRMNQQEAMDHALMTLFPDELEAYDALMDAIEAVSESVTVVHENQAYDCLLIGLPILAWTRFYIPSGTMAPDVVSALSQHLHDILLAPQVNVTLAPTLYAIDQLPRNHCEVYALMKKYLNSALSSMPINTLEHPAETTQFLADTRYCLALLTTRQGGPLFQWQFPNGKGYSGPKKNVLEQWQTDTMSTFTQLLPGCGIELLLPQAYYTSCREGDQRIRPLSIRAASYYLTQTLEIPIDQIHATIAGFSEESGSLRVDEYRIGYSIGQQTKVIYGVVWPLHEQEDIAESLSIRVASQIENRADIPRTPLEQIIFLLREAGITHIHRHSEIFQMEFCDDCGTPLYPDRQAEVVHPETPDNMPQTPTHLH